MSITKKIITAVALAALSTPSLAAKVAVFDAQAAILSTKQAQQADAELNKNPEYANLLAELQTLQADLKALAKEEETNGMTWSADDRQKHRGKIEFKVADRKLIVQKLQALQAQARQVLIQELGPKVQSILDEIISAEGLDMVLTRGSAQQPTVIYASDEVDITPEVTNKLNKLK